MPRGAPFPQLTTGPCYFAPKIVDVVIDVEQAKPWTHGVVPEIPPMSDEPVQILLLIVNLIEQIGFVHCVQCRIVSAT